MFHSDFLIRQIQFMTEAIACVIFNKETTAKYEIRSNANQTESDLLYVLLCDLIARKSINEAENILFDMLDSNNHDHLVIATDFYSRLNSLTDEELEDADFSREEIVNGLNEVKKIFDL